jgi:hypothetical protein
MKIKCQNCKYIFQIEKGYGDESEDTVLCLNCNKEISLLSIEEYNEQDDIEYINTNTWEENKIIKIPLNTGRVFFTGIIIIAIGLFGFIQAIINKSWGPNIYIYIIFSIIGCYILLMYFYGKLIFSIGKNSFIFTGVGKIGFKKKIDWNTVKEIYRDKSLLKRGRKYYIILRGNKKVKIDITWLNENTRECLLNTLRDLRYKKK